jgi:transposase, IS30 family
MFSPSQSWELLACLRQAHNKRTPRSKGQDRRGQIPDMLSIHVRPLEIEDRQFPGQWRGDLINGEANATAVCSLVERASRLLMLIKLAHPKPLSAANVLQAFKDKLRSEAQPMRLSMTYDQGREMAMHKGADVSSYSQEQLDTIADEINNRPRKGLGVRSPLAVYRELLLNNPQHATPVH